MVTNLKKHIVSPSNSYIFDTNVWIFIYGPIASHNFQKQNAYSNLLKEIQSRKAGLYITSLILSEYVNKVLRIEFNNWKSAHPELVQPDFKKDFRKATEFNNCLNDVKNQVLEILKLTERRPDDFNALDINAIFNDVNNSLDFNDSLIANACSRGHCILVTDDKDFDSCGLALSIVRA